MSKLNDLEGALYKTVSERSKNADALLQKANERNEGRVQETRQSLAAAAKAKKGASGIAFVICAVALLILYKVTGIF